MVYAPVGRPFKVRMDSDQRARGSRPGGSTRATGKATPIGEFPNTGERDFTPPDPGEMLDWVLVLDDAAQGYPPPGVAGPLSSPRATR